MKSCKECLRLITFAMFLLITVSKAQRGINNLKAETTHKCLDSIYNYRFFEAKKIIQVLPESQPLVRGILTAFCFRWEYIPIYQSKQKEAYISLLNKIISICKDNNMQSPNYRFAYISAHLLLADVYFHEDNIIKALLHGSKSYTYLIQSFEEKEIMPEFYFVQGLYLYYLDSYRHKGFLYSSMLSPFKRGDRKKGITLLELSSIGNSMLRIESMIYLGHIYLHLENSPEKALKYSMKLTDLYPNNLKFSELLMENYFVLKDYTKSKTLIQKQLQSEIPYYQIPALFIEGCIHWEKDANARLSKKTFVDCLALINKYQLCENYKRKIKEKLEIIKDK